MSSAHFCANAVSIMCAVFRRPPAPSQSEHLSWRLVIFYYNLQSQPGLQVIPLLAISQSPESSRANPMLEGQEIWQHTFKLNV